MFGSTENSKVDLARRDFLIRSCQGAAAVLLPSGLNAFALDSIQPRTGSPPGEFHLHPHYRSQTPLDALLLQTESGLDQFITEKYHDQLAAILTQWSTSLLQSPREAAVIGQSLAVDFLGSSLQPIESRLVRSALPVEVHRCKFAEPELLDRTAFLQRWQTSLNIFSKLFTVEFQITGIEESSGIVKTRIRYELVGTGKDFHREQHVGEWSIEWAISTQLEFRIRRWQALHETQSRSASPVYVDITAAAFESSASYSQQLLRGADHWRSVLDVACGIDIYGHNGISVGDIDGNGFDDLYVCQAAGLPNRLYRNQRDGTFEDITEASGLGILDNTACALFADLNNNGCQDLIVVCTNGPLLFLNDGHGKFRQKQDAFQFSMPPQGTFTGAAIADYDRDGWLDIYFCLYLYYQGADQYKYPSPYYDAENGPPNFLMRNNRDGTFRDQTAASGLDKNNTRYSFCCSWSDFNDDGWPDLYVVNDFGRKNLYRNNGDGTFTDVAPQVGAEDIGAGMSVCWFDYDNDGAEDLYVGDMWTAAGTRISTLDLFQKEASEEVRAQYRKHAMGNSLLHNKNDNTFEDASVSAGVGMGRWAWCSDTWDFDHDGFPDLYVTNGMVSGPSRKDLNSFFWRQVVANSPAEAKPAPEYEQGWTALNELLRSDGTWSGYERNVFYANNRDGSFSDISAPVGLDFLEDGRAFALADFDHDGRLEVFLKNRNAPQLRLLKNVMSELPPSIVFRLQGTKSNRDAIGARITLETESGRQTHTLRAGSGFLSQHSKEILFGLGAAKGPIQVSIHWPSGLVQEVHDLPANHRIWVKEGVQPSRIELFRQPSFTKGLASISLPLADEPLPDRIETWLIVPVAAPDFSLCDATKQTLSSLRGKPVLLNFWSAQSASIAERNLMFPKSWTPHGLHLQTVNVDDNEDVAAVYNILYRYLFDRHRDLALPTSFLIDNKGDIVKVYQGLLNREQAAQDFRNIPQTPVERLVKALPFQGVTDVLEYRRNSLSLGSGFFQRGYYEPAEAFFQRVLQDEPESAEALYGLGSVYLKQQKAAEARKSFTRATQQHASYPETLPNAWNNLGLLATQDGNATDAIPYFEHALQLSPSHLIALVNLGNAYRQQKQWENASRVLQRALKVSAEDPEANYSLGMVYAQTEDTTQAFGYLRKALKARPVYPEALNNLGVLYLHTNRRNEAVATFEECIRLAPVFDQSYLNLARVYALEGDPSKARTILLDLLKQHPNDAQAQKALEQLPKP